MSDEKDAPPEEGLRVKDLLRAGTLEEHEHKGEAFGRSVMNRRYRRPVGNSERLWKKVDGEDPWDEPKVKTPPKQRGVYASGRFVRIDKGGPKKAQPEKSHIPDLARKRQSDANRARSNPAAEVKATPTSDDPLERLQQIIRQRNADNETRASKARDAATRIKRKVAEPEPEPEEEVEVAPPVPAKPRSSKTGRLRTHAGQPVVKKVRKTPVKNRVLAAGREAKTRGPITDIPVEMRTPPRVAHEPKGAKADPNRPRKYAAGRGPAKGRAEAVDLPLEMRRPPRIAPNAPEAAPKPERYAAGRGPKAAPKKAVDIPLEQRRPPRIGADGLPMESAAPAATVPVPGDEAAALPDSPPTFNPPPPKAPPRMPKSGGGGMDDLFGLAASEGPMRIGRRRKKTAVAEPEKKD
ncbi:MAG: hypothetical protein AB8H79_13015 [Myxococcota bacterium]